MQCYIVQDRLADGLAYVSLESFQRGQTDMGRNYLRQALSVDPNNEVALAIQQEFGDNNVDETTQIPPQGSGGAKHPRIFTKSQVHILPRRNTKLVQIFLSYHAVEAPVAWDLLVPMRFIAVV